MSVNCYIFVFLPFPHWHIVTLCAPAVSQLEFRELHSLLLQPSRRKLFTLLLQPSVITAGPVYPSQIPLWQTGPHCLVQTLMEPASQWILFRAPPAGGRSRLLCASWPTSLTRLLSRRDILIKWAPHDASAALKNTPAAALWSRGAAKANFGRFQSVWTPDIWVDAECAGLDEAWNNLEQLVLRWPNFWTSGSLWGL